MCNQHKELAGPIAMDNKSHNKMYIKHVMTPHMVEVN